MTLEQWLLASSAEKLHETVLPEFHPRDYEHLVCDIDHIGILKRFHVVLINTRLRINCSRRAQSRCSQLSQMPKIWILRSNLTLDNWCPLEILLFSFPLK
jgi:hypothetical protein